MKFFTRFLFLVLLLVPRGTRSADVEMIAHTTVRELHVSNSRARSIFFGEVTRWSNGVPITVFVLPVDHPATRRFTWETLRVSPYVFQERVSEVAASNRPQQVETETQMINSVANTPGGVGFVSAFTILINKNAAQNSHIIDVRP